MKRRTAPFVRREAGRIDVRLPSTVRKFLRVAAQRLGRVGEEPGTVAYSRLFGHVDEEHPIDDPAIVLSRQLMIDDIAASVAATVTAASISDDEAEAWLALLGMTIAMHAAELGVRSDEAREALAPADRAFIAALQHLQLCLIDALDSPASARGSR